MTLSQAHTTARRRFYISSVNFKNIPMCVYRRAHSATHSAHYAVALQGFVDSAENTLIAVYPVIKITQYKDAPPDKPLYLSDISYKYWGTS